MASKGVRTKPERGPSGALAEYHRVADTIGGVPNLRLKDNVMQAAAVGAGTVLGAIAGALGAPSLDATLAVGASVGGGLGFIVSGVLSGLVLMVIGLARGSKRD